MGVGTEPEDAGGLVTVTLGAQKFAPVQYHSFDVGPYSVTATRGPGETLAEVHARVMPGLRSMAQADYEASVVEFLARVRGAASSARGGGR